MLLLANQCFHDVTNLEWSSAATVDGRGLGQVVEGLMISIKKNVSDAEQIIIF